MAASGKAIWKINILRLAPDENIIVKNHCYPDNPGDISTTIDILMHKSRLVLFIIVSSFLTACTSLGRLDNTAKVESPEESIFVIGVNPDNYRISVFPGSIKDGAFKQNPLRVAAIFDSAQDGYVVGKADAGDTLAITWLRIVGDKNDLMGSDYRPCQGKSTLAFETPAGKVIYLTDVTFKLDENGPNMEFNDNLTAAKAHVDSRFPNLKGHLEQWEYKIVPVSDSCTINIYIPRTT